MFKAGLMKIILILLLINGSQVIWAQEQGKPDLQPEDSALIYAYGSMGYYQWKMISVVNYMSLFTGDKAGGLNYQHDATPFVVKRYGVKANFLIFSLGLDYLSDQFGIPTEFNSQEQLEKTQGESAKQIKLLSGINLGAFILQANVTLREFQSKITSNGLQDWSGNVYPIRYYPKGGNVMLLNQGDTASWYTRFTEYEVKLVFPDPFFSIDLGIKYMIYDAPSEANINKSPIGIPYGEPYGMGDALMFTRNHIINAFIGMNFISQFSENIFLQIYLPLSFALPGGYKIESDFIPAGSSEFLTMSGLTVSSTGFFNLFFKNSFFKLQGGFDYGFFYSQTEVKDVAVQKNITFFDTIRNQFVTVNAGQKASFRFQRMELFWGLSLSASIFF
jgi:hypothetical protein